MADLIDRAILIGIGMEKKIKEFLDELQKLGKEDLGEEAKGEGGEELSAKKTLENRIVDEGVRCVKELIETLKSSREKLEKEVLGSSEKLLGKLHMATKEDIDTVKEMARVAREKVDRLEKKITELEGKKKKHH